MILPLAHEILFLAAVIIHPMEWQPSISLRAIESRQSLREEQFMAPVIEREMWTDAATDAAVSLLQAYLDAKILFEDKPPNGTAAAWWSEVLHEDPVVAAAALPQLSTHYLVWRVDQWPETHADVLPEYRIALVETMFGAYVALSERVENIRTEIAEFEKISITPPEGWPFRTDPSYIKDPKLREEYRGRLAEVARQEAVRGELSRSVNVLGEYEVVLADEVKFLYRDANPIEVQRLADTIIARGWDGNKLHRAILSDWDGLRAFSGDGAD